MDCLQVLAKGIVDRMDELGWLVPASGTVQPTAILPNLLALPQLPTPSSLTTADYQDGLITVRIAEATLGVTYEVNLIDAQGKMKIAPHIALYVGQEYHLPYRMQPSEPLYVTLVATKKGYDNSDLVAIAVKYN